jgi:hypothetical protein
LRCGEIHHLAQLFSSSDSARTDKSKVVGLRMNFESTRRHSAGNRARHLTCKKRNVSLRFRVRQFDQENGYPGCLKGAASSRSKCKLWHRCGTCQRGLTVLLVQRPFLSFPHGRCNLSFLHTSSYRQDPSLGLVAYSERTKWGLSGENHCPESLRPYLPYPPNK